MSDNDNTIEARLVEASEQLVASFSQLDTEAELRAVRSGSLPAGGAHENGRWPRWLAVAAAVRVGRRRHSCDRGERRGEIRERQRLDAIDRHDTRCALQLRRAVRR